jgi:membrane protease YdiL (CAAX protease family)
MPSIPPPAPVPQPAPSQPPASQPPERRPSDRDAGWPIWIAPAAVAAGLAGGVLASSIVDGIGGAAGSNVSHPSTAVSLIADLVFDLSFVVAALYFASLRGRPRPADFGYRRVAPMRAIGAVAIAGISYYVLTALYASAVHLHGNDKLPSELGVGKSTVALAAAGLFVCVIAPIAEEFFFRGFLFGVLRRMRIVVAGHQLGPWVAAVITGILFGLAHTGSASSQYLVPLGFLGFVLCLVRWKTGSLYPCMALHSINNSLALGVNQLNWNAAEIIALIIGSLLVIGAITGPLSRSERPA